MITNLKNKLQNILLIIPTLLLHCHAVLDPATTQLTYF